MHSYFIKDLKKVLVGYSIGKNKYGNAVVRRGFFYTHGYTSEKLAEYIKDTMQLHGIKGSIVNHGETWKQFKGGASVANQSHWWVEIKEMELQLDNGL